jgi:hypothetical protein
MDRFYKPTSFDGTLSIGQKVEVNRIRGTHQTVGLGLRRQNLSEEKGDTRMRIKFKEAVSTKTNPNAAGKTYSILRIKGTALGGKLAGQEWSTQIFQSAREMVEQVKALKDGDIVDVKMIKNGNYWNPQSFDKVKDEDADFTVKPSHSGSGGSVPANPRLDNLKVAVNVMGPKKAKQTAADYLMEAKEVADLVQDYVDEKGVFQFQKDGVKDVPDVPDVDDADDSLI